MSAVLCALVNDNAPESMVQALLAEGYKIFTISHLANALAQNDVLIQQAYQGSMNSITQYPFEVQGARFNSAGELVIAVSMNLTMTFGIAGIRKDRTTGVETPGFRHARTSVIISKENSLYNELAAYAGELETLGAKFASNNTIDLTGTKGQGLYQQVLNLGDDPYSHMLFTIEKRELNNTEVSADGVQYVISDITLYDVAITRKTASTVTIKETASRFGRPKAPSAPVAPVAARPPLAPYRSTTTVVPAAPVAAAATAAADPFM
jgi:hypothetical protein